MSIIQKYGKLGSKEGEFDHPKNIQVYEDKLYVNDSNNSRVQIFRIKPNELEYINSITDIINPNCLVIDKNGQIWVGENNKKINVYDQNGILIKTLNIEHYNFAINDDGYIVYIGHYEPYISIYNNGTIKTRFISNPYRVTINSNGHILVNHYSCRIRVFNKNLEWLFDIQNDIYINSIYSMCIHRFDKILLGCKNSIKILEVDGEKYRYISLKAIPYSYIYGIAHHGENIIVSEYNNHCIKIIKDALINEEID